MEYTAFIFALCALTISILNIGLSAKMARLERKIKSADGRTDCVAVFNTLKENINREIVLEFYDCVVALLGKKTTVLDVDADWLFVRYTDKKGKHGAQMLVKLENIKSVTL